MTDTDVDDIGVLSGDRLSIKVPADLIGEDPDTWSFRSVTSRSKGGTVTIMFDADLPTRFRWRGGTWAFDGFRFFPRVHGGDVRRTLVDVDLIDGDYTDLPDDHPARDLRLRDLIGGFRSGRMTPAPKAER